MSCEANQGDRYGKPNKVLHIAFFAKEKEIELLIIPILNIFQNYKFSNK